MKALFPYQTEGAHWLAEQRIAFLADEMGLGKSAQAIRACDILKAKKVLVVSPAVVTVNWQREFQIFSSTNITPTTVSYDYLTRHAHKFKTDWDVLILDEAHFLKTPKAKRTKTILGKQGLIHKARRTYFLSGTPMPNHPAELWPWLFTTGITRLTYEQFVKRFCTYYVFGSNPYSQRFQITGAKNSRIPELRELIKPHLLRRKKEEVMKQLPPITFTDITITPGDVVLDEDPWFVEYTAMTDRSHELYEKLQHERAFMSEAIDRATRTPGGTKRNIFLAMEALAPSVSTLRRYTGMQKVGPIQELVEEELERNAYEKIVLFAIHQSVIESLRQRLIPFRPLTLYGKTPPDKRQRNIDAFQNKKAHRVFIANIGAAGTGITLTAANQGIFVEQDWVPGNNAQAAMRLHRIGQKRPVFIRTAVLHDSLDQKINETLKRKLHDQMQIIDGKKVLSSHTSSGKTELTQSSLVLPRELLD